MNKALLDKIDFVTGEAEEAFWAVVAKNFPECQTGDLDPISSFNFDIECSKVVTEWVFANSVIVQKARNLHDIIEEAKDKLTLAGAEFNEAIGSEKEYSEISSMVLQSVFSLLKVRDSIEDKILDEEVE